MCDCIFKKNFFTVYSVYYRFDFLFGLLQSPQMKIGQSSLLSIFMKTIKAGLRNTICDFFKWSMMSLKCGLPICTNGPIFVKRDMR